MLNPFPIQFLSMLAYLLLRLFVGSILLYLGTSHISKRNEIKDLFAFSLLPNRSLSVWLFAIFEVLSGIMFILGFYTQIAALIGMALALKMLVFHDGRTALLPGRLFYVLLLGACLSLFITGAGALAFDLPI